MVANYAADHWNGRMGTLALWPLPLPLLQRQPQSRRRRRTSGFLKNWNGMLLEISLLRSAINDLRIEAHVDAL